LSGRDAHPAAPLIEQAMMGYGTLAPLDGGNGPERVVSLDFLRAQARSAYQAYQATRYDAVGRTLPGLIRGVETAARATGTASAAACTVRARVYDTTAALLGRVGESFLAWAAADRAIFAAEQSGDPLLAAASAWRLSYMITGRKHPSRPPLTSGPPGTKPWPPSAPLMAPMSAACPTAAAAPARHLPPRDRLGPPVRRG
jgi:hypothetical protein